MKDAQGKPAVLIAITAVLTLTAGLLLSTSVDKPVDNTLASTTSTISLDSDIADLQAMKKARSLRPTPPTSRVATSRPPKQNKLVPREPHRASRSKPVATKAPVQKEHVSVPRGTLKQYAASLVGASQFSCLEPLWEHESGWNVYATNGGSAYGIPQALPGSKMASAGADWRTNGRTQIRWGVGYIQGRYGSSCNAYAHWKSHNWY